VIASLIPIATVLIAITAPRAVAAGGGGWTPPTPAFQAGQELRATANHLEGDFTRHHLLLTGNVTLVSGTQEIHAERLSVTLDAERRRIQTLDGSGQVRLIYGPYTAIADRALFDTATGQARLLGNARVWGEGRETAGATIDLNLQRKVVEITAGRVHLPAHGELPALRVAADTIVADDASGRAELTGAVEVTSGARRLTADHAVVDLDPATGDVRQLRADGHLRIADGDRRGRADRGAYDLVKRSLVLEGNADLTQGSNRLRGDRIRVDLTTRRVQVERGTIQYRQD
jgi:lipopolysaccharide transport protein LptA